MNQRHTINKAARAGDPGLRLTHSLSRQVMANLFALHSWAYTKYYHIARPNHALTVIRFLNYIVPF